MSTQIKLTGHKETIEVWEQGEIIIQPIPECKHMLHSKKRYFRDKCGRTYKILQISQPIKDNSVLILDIKNDFSDEIQDKYNPNYPSPLCKGSSPGKILEKELKYRNIGVEDLSNEVLLRKCIQNIIDDSLNHEITPSIALLLEYKLEISSDIWLNIELQYRRDLLKVKKQIGLDRS